MARRTHSHDKSRRVPSIFQPLLEPAALKIRRHAHTFVSFPTISLTSWMRWSLACREALMPHRSRISTG